MASCEYWPSPFTAPVTLPCTQVSSGASVITLPSPAQTGAQTNVPSAQTTTANAPLNPSVSNKPPTSTPPPPAASGAATSAAPSSPNSTLNKEGTSTPSRIIPGASSSSSTSALASQSVEPISSPSTSNVPKSSSGVAPGAVAGIAIAMLIVGGLIVGLVLFFLFRRRQKRSNVQQYNHPGGYYATGNEKGPTVAASAVPGGINDILPQPVEDDAITGELSKIRDQIKNHIRTHYDFGQVHGAVDDSQFVQLAGDSGLKTSVLVNGLNNSSPGNEFPRLFLAWAILSRCSADRHPTLLPTEVTGVPPPLSGKDSRHDALYSKWKAITGYLIQSHRADASAFQSQSLGQIIADIDLVLAPFAKETMDDNLRKANLDMIVKRAASFAFLLFTQPGSFRFDFHSLQGSLVVFPSLLQVISDQGQLLNPPRQLSEHEVVAVQGL